MDLSRRRTSLDRLGHEAEEDEADRQLPRAQDHLLSSSNEEMGRSVGDDIGMSRRRTSLD
jgi:hypothetical protein